MSILCRFKLQRDDLEKKLGSGIPRGSIVLVEGEHGAGKSVLMQRLAYGLLENGHSVTFISTQFTTKDFISQMYSLNFPILPYLPNNKLLFIPIYSLITETQPKDFFLEKLIKTKDLYQSDVLIIDTLSSIIRHTIDRDKITDLIAFFKRMAGTGKTILISVGEGELNDDMRQTLVTSAHIQLSIKQKTIGDRIKHTLVVNKYLSAEEPYTTITNFRIVPKIGFIIEISSVA